MTARRPLPPALSTLLACPHCGNQPTVRELSPGIPTLNWEHQSDCPVPDSPTERARMLRAVVLALAALDRGGTT
jgi:hypothetical protein